MQRGAVNRQSYNGGSSTPAADLQIQGIPVSNRQATNGTLISQSKKASNIVKERGLKSKNAKETKEQKEKNEADHKS